MTLAIPNLNEAERAELAALLVGRGAWAPLAGPQRNAYHSEADILLYGGAAGGGKTDLLLGLPRHQHHRAVIFRRVFPSLRGIIDRSREIYNPLGDAASKDSYNESLHRWKFRDGRSVRFGSLQHEDNKTDWQGQAHDFYGFDEITEFTEGQFRYVTTWNRTTRPGQRCRIVCTANPPTNSDGEWILAFWAPWLDPTHPNPAKPGELRWFTTYKGKDIELPNGDPVLLDGELVYPRSRTFIPARVQDNPFLMASGYVAQLQALPEPLRSKMLYGDFLAGREDDAYQVIPTEWILQAQARWRARPRPTTPMSAIGGDVARGGKDRSVLTPRYDNWFDEQIVEPGKATPDGQAFAAFVQKHRKDGAKVNIDVVGVGSSPFDFCRMLFGDDAVYAMNGAAGSEARDKSQKLGFVNQRAEWYWKLREALDPATGEDLALPPDPELRSDLAAPHWKLKTNGIQIEAKEEIAERIGRSPDKGDSLVYAHAIPFVPGAGLLEFYRSKAKEEEEKKRKAKEAGRR